MPNNSLKKSLRKASAHAVALAAESLKGHVQVGRWIGPKNVYAKVYKNPRYKGISDSLKRVAFRPHQINQYVAASVVTHCCDGWSQLGRAVQCQARGDSNAAVHLAYYAELRAAMSLLAAEGVGVFVNTHAVVGDGSTTKTSKKRTHEFVWMALEHWAARQVSAKRISITITPGGISLKTWFDSFNITPSIHPIGEAWLKRWGIDIKQFADDRLLRNQASYRPSRISPRAQLPASDSLIFLKELWESCEPSPPSRFDHIDKHLLRSSLADAYQSINSTNPRTNMPAYRNWIQANIPKLNLNPKIEKVWVDFLTWSVSPQDSAVISKARLVSSSLQPDHHLQVIARATLLLRVATGAASALLTDAGFTRNDLSFWWQPYLIDNGISGAGNLPADFMDLWADADTAVQDVSNWQNGNPPTISYNDVLRGLASQMSTLSECERIALWGLAL